MWLHIVNGLLLPFRLYVQPQSSKEQFQYPGLSPFYSIWSTRRVTLKDRVFREKLAGIILETISAGCWLPFSLIVFSSLGLPFSSALLNNTMPHLPVTVTMLYINLVCIIVSPVLPFLLPVSLIQNLLLFAVPLAILEACIAGHIADETLRNCVSGFLFGGVIAWSTAEKPFTRPQLILGIGLTLAAIVFAGPVYALGICIGYFLISSRILLYPLETIINIVLLFLLRTIPNLPEKVLYATPIYWDEAMGFQLPYNRSLCAVLFHTHPTFWTRIAEKLRKYDPFSVILREITTQRIEEILLSVNSLQLIANMYSFPYPPIEALPYSPNEPKNFLEWRRLMTDMISVANIKQEVSSALESDSATNKVWRLREAIRLLEEAKQNSGPFSRVFQHWDEFLHRALREAQQRQQNEEPIPQVYISGNPIFPGQRMDADIPFKGRKSLFLQLEQALGGANRSTLVLYGQRRTGKTSILLQLPRRLGSNVLPIFLDMQGLSNAQNTSGFLGNVASKISKNVATNYNMTLPSIDEVRLQSDPYSEFEHWLDSVEAFIGTRSILLCIDEYEAIDGAISRGHLDTRILSTIRSVIQHHHKISILLSGSHELEELPPYWASALITTQMLHVSFLDSTDAHELICHPIDSFPEIYTPDAVERIIYWTRCQPYLIQLLCGLLVETMNKTQRIPPDSYVTSADVEAVIPKSLIRGTSYFLDLWNNQIEGTSIQELLEAFVQSPAHYLSADAAETIDSSRNSLRLLLRREVIERKEQGYHIAVPLIGEYIRQQSLS